MKNLLLIVCIIFLTSCMEDRSVRRYLNSVGWTEVTIITTKDDILNCHGLEPYRTGFIGRYNGGEFVGGTVCCWDENDCNVRVKWPALSD